MMFATVLENREDLTEICFVGLAFLILCLLFAYLVERHARKAQEQFCKAQELLRKEQLCKTQEQLRNAQEQLRKAQEQVSLILLPSLDRSSGPPTIADSESSGPTTMTDSETQEHQLSRLERLPSELRTQIWYYAVVEDEPVIAAFPTNEKRTAWYTVQPKLAMVNKQIRDETLPMYYAENTFVLEYRYKWSRESMGRYTTRVMKWLQSCRRFVLNA